ncbi:MAG: glycosyltransferase family 1 protein [Prevotella sp.]|nr:glycosyltransferase family 1 protein [Prevotella sp.]
MRHAISTIVPSRFEGFGRCLPEAMLCNCVTIGRDTAGTKEQYDNGFQLTGEEIGFRFHNVDELVLCLEKLCSASSQELQAVRERALRTVSEYYTQQRYINSIIQFYERIERERSH